MLILTKIIILIHLHFGDGMNAKYANDVDIIAGNVSLEQ